MAKPNAKIAYLQHFFFANILRISDDSLTHEHTVNFISLWNASKWISHPAVRLRKAFFENQVYYRLPEKCF